MSASPLDRSLADRLEEVGLDPTNFGDPQQEWQRLHDRLGRRATLIDRYALEAARRGVRPEQLAADERARLTREVLSVQYPGMEFTAASGRPVADPVELVAYSDEWAHSFQVWRKRLSEALGDAAVRIEHVGSTSVAGLGAKPIIDIQVSVMDVEDEDAYVPAIEAFGRFASIQRARTPVLPAEWRLASYCADPCLPRGRRMGARASALSRLPFVPIGRREMRMRG